jgi:hypothetical protein
METILPYDEAMKDELPKMKETEVALLIVQDGDISEPAERNLSPSSASAIPIDTMDIIAPSVEALDQVATEPLSVVITWNTGEAGNTFVGHIIPEPSSGENQSPLALLAGTVDTAVMNHGMPETTKSETATTEINLTDGDFFGCTYDGTSLREEKKLPAPSASYLAPENTEAISSPSCEAMTEETGEITEKVIVWIATDSGERDSSPSFDSACEETSLGDEQECLFSSTVASCPGTVEATSNEDDEAMEKRNHSALETDSIVGESNTSFDTQSDEISQLRELDLSQSSAATTTPDDNVETISKYLASAKHVTIDTIEKQALVKMSDNDWTPTFDSETDDISQPRELDLSPVTSKSLEAMAAITINVSEAETTSYDCGSTDDDSIRSFYSESDEMSQPPERSYITTSSQSMTFAPGNQETNETTRPNAKVMKDEQSESENEGAPDVKILTRSSSCTQGTLLGSSALAEGLDTIASPRINLEAELAFVVTRSAAIVPVWNGAQGSPTASFLLRRLLENVSADRHVPLDTLIVSNMYILEHMFAFLASSGVPRAFAVQDIHRKGSCGPEIPPSILHTGSMYIPLNPFFSRRLQIESYTHASTTPDFYLIAASKDSIDVQDDLNKFGREMDDDDDESVTSDCVLCTRSNSSFDSPLDDECMASKQISARLFEDGKVSENEHQRVEDVTTDMVVRLRSRESILSLLVPLMTEPKFPAMPSTRQHECYTFGTSTKGVLKVPQGVLDMVALIESKHKSGSNNKKSNRHERKGPTLMSLLHPVNYAMGTRSEAPRPPLGSEDAMLEMPKEFLDMVAFIGSTHRETSANEKPSATTGTRSASLPHPISYFSNGTTSEASTPLCGSDEAMLAEGFAPLCGSKEAMLKLPKDFLDMVALMGSKQQGEPKDEQSCTHDPNSVGEFPPQAISDCIGFIEDSTPLCDYKDTMLQLPRDFVDIVAPAISKQMQGLNHEKSDTSEISEDANLCGSKKAMLDIKKDLFDIASMVTAHNPGDLFDRAFATFTCTGTADNWNSASISKSPYDEAGSFPFRDMESRDDVETNRMSRDPASLGSRSQQDETARLRVLGHQRRQYVPDQSKHTTLLERRGESYKNADPLVLRYGSTTTNNGKMPSVPNPDVGQRSPTSAFAIIPPSGRDRLGNIRNTTNNLKPDPPAEITSDLVNRTQRNWQADGHALDELADTILFEAPLVPKTERRQFLDHRRYLYLSLRAQTGSFASEEERPPHAKTSQVEPRTNEPKKISTTPHIVTSGPSGAQSSHIRTMGYPPDTDSKLPQNVQRAHSCRQGRTARIGLEVKNDVSSSCIQNDGSSFSARRQILVERRAAMEGDRINRSSGRQQVEKNDLSGGVTQAHNTNFSCATLVETISLPDDIKVETATFSSAVKVETNDPPVASKVETIGLPESMQSKKISLLRARQPEHISSHATKVGKIDPPGTRQFEKMNRPAATQLETIGVPFVKRIDDTFSPESFQFKKVNFPGASSHVDQICKPPPLSTKGDMINGHPRETSARTPVSAKTPATSYVSQPLRSNGATLDQTTKKASPPVDSKPSLMEMSGRILAMKNHAIRQKEHQSKGLCSVPTTITVDNIVVSHTLESKSQDSSRNEQDFQALRSVPTTIVTIDNVVISSNTPESTTVSNTKDSRHTSSRTYKLSHLRKNRGVNGSKAFAPKKSPVPSALSAVQPNRWQDQGQQQPVTPIASSSQINFGGAQYMPLRGAAPMSE